MNENIKQDVNQTETEWGNGIIEKYQFYLGGGLNNRFRRLMAAESELTGQTRVMTHLVRQAIILLLEKRGY